MRVLDRIMAVVAALLVAATAVSTCLAVYFRYVTDAALAWPEEISGYLLVWISFAGAYLALRDGGHINLDLFVDKLSERPRAAVKMAVDGLVAAFLFLLGALSVRMIAIVGDTPLETVDLPQGVFMASIPISSFAMALALVVGMAARWRERSASRDRAEGRP
jgi:TRAP-type C4-dicarboxylate transport system permease small subunit